MTSKECGQAITNKLREIWDIYQEFYPGGDQLNLMVTADLACVWNGELFSGGEKALDYYEFVKEVGADAND